MRIKSAGCYRTVDALIEYLDARISHSEVTTSVIMLHECVERIGRD